MKSKLSLCLALALAFSLAACGQAPEAGPLRLENNTQMLDDVLREGSSARPGEGEFFSAMEIDADPEAGTAQVRLIGDQEFSGSLEAMSCIPIEDGGVSGWYCNFRGELKSGETARDVSIILVLSGGEGFATLSFYRANRTMMNSWFGVMEGDLAVVNAAYNELIRELQARDEAAAVG
jgi:hypothetical protein